ncbi:DUF1266 domain-containing protein [Streptomyces tubbatahanensis]|uniref:DUF1266 domain-containing protein n=1 Tax=Streptomyces tubbatahanensis TaxID=2923272 RepID=UPI003C6FC003
MWKRGAAGEVAGPDVTKAGGGGGAAGAATTHPESPDHPGTRAAAWREIPSDVERRLYEAKSRHDWAAYLDVLAGEPLYHAAPRGWLEANPGRVAITPVWRPEIRAWCTPVYTEAMLPAPIDNPVFFSQSLGWFARGWEATDPPWLAVNPGSPCEAYFPSGPGFRALWQRHADNVTHACTPAHETLRTLWVGGPRTGAVARGLACGALMSVKNGRYWNALGHGHGYTDERRLLDRWWGVTTRETWQRHQEDLLTAEMSSPVWEFALGVRHSLAQDFGGHVETGHWRQATERVLRSRVSTARVELTPEGVTRTEGPSEEEMEAQVAGVKRLIGRITRYEARFRADGLLPEGRFVRSVAAWDYGRASNMARFGLGARFCTLAEAEEAVLRAGRVSTAAYRSWEDFSAGYALGRCLHFDDEEFGPFYEETLTGHRLLTTEPESPWLTIPFRSEGD